MKLHEHSLEKPKATQMSVIGHLLHAMLSVYNRMKYTHFGDNISPKAKQN